MPQETKDLEQIERKNTIALTWMIFSIIWFLFFIIIIWLKLWIILLTIWLILGIIGLFYKPRGKARVAITIPIIAIIIFIIGYNYVKNSTPATEFSAWFEDISNNKLYSDILSDNNFLKSAQQEFKETIKSKDWNEIKERLNYSEWSNIFEKRIYVFFDLKKECLENSLEKYSIDSDISDTDDEISKDYIDETEESDKFDDNEKEYEEKIEEAETIEIFDNWENNDIEEIINILW